MAQKIAYEIEIKNIKKIADLKKELKDLRKEQKKHEAEAKSGRFQSKKDTKAYVERAGAIKKNSKELRDLNKNMGASTQATKKATKSSNSMAKQFIKGAAAIGILVGAFRAVNRIVSSIVSVFTEFEFVMAKVNAVSGATESEFAALNKTAEELGRTTFFTAAQVGELMLNFSKLGFTAQEIQDAVKPTLDLATATGSDLARAATVAGAAVRGFGLDASETQRVVDVMAVSFSSSAMNIEKWQTSMTKVAPIAKAAGFSIEDTAAIMSKLTDSGIEASIAGTSLRNILLKMQDPTSELSMRFGRTIHSLDDLVPAMKQFVAEGGSMADVMEVVDLRQAAAFEQMITTADGTLALRDALLDANGEGARMAAIVGDTLQGAFLKFTSAMQGLSIGVMKDFSKGLQGAVETAARFLNMLAENSKAISTTIKWVTKLIRIVGLYKLGVMAATKWTYALRVAKVAWWKMNKILTVSTISLTGAVNALKWGIKGLLSSTGIGLLVAFIPEILNLLGLWGDDTDDLIESQKSLKESITDTYHDSIQPIEKLKKTSEELIRVKGLMNDMIDEEGNLLEDTAINQKIYNKYKGQAAILTRGLNTELKKNDQELITEKTSIENVATAIDTLTAALMNQALVKGFEKQIERIAEVAANAEITRQKLATEFDLNLDDDARVRSWHEATKASDEYFKKSGSKQETAYDRFTEIMKGGGFNTLDEMLKALSGSDEQIEIVTKAFDKLAGGDGIGALILSTEKSTKTTQDNENTITKWSDKMAEAMLKVKQAYADGETSAEQYRDATLDTTKDILTQELNALNKVEKKTQGQAQRVIAIKTKLAGIEIKINDNKFKKDLENLTLTHQAEKDKIIEQYTVNGQLTATGNQLLLQAEADYLIAKGQLHEDYKIKLLNNNSAILKNDLQLQQSQRQILDEQISAYSAVGSSLQALAGDNEKLSKVMEIGIAITEAATLAQNLLNLSDQLGIVLSGTKTTTKLGEAAAENISTISIIGNTVAEIASLIPKAISAVLSSTKLPPPFGLIAAIAMFAFVKKLMSWKGEDGGVIPEFARGGMVNGKSHAQGGEKFSVGGRVVELEGGEAVINKRSTSMFRDQLSSMNAAGGGVKFADGGLLNMPSFTESQFNALSSSPQGGTQKVVVVEADITESQNTVGVIEANATF